MNDNAATFRRTVDPDAIAQNYRLLAKASGQADCGAAVKANAYGCNIKKIIPILLSEGCNNFFVADAVEGMHLRKIAKSANIYVLNGYVDGAARLLSEFNLIPIINSEHQLSQWRNSGLKSDYTLHIDTGMNRLGVRHDEAFKVLAELNIRPTMIMSHFACADDRKNLANRRQLQLFSKIASKFPTIKASMANSAATLSIKDAQFQKTRPGIAIYGANPFSNEPNPMNAAVTAHAKIIDIRHVAKGETISYGGTCSADKPMRIAVCGVGYADGYPRGASGHGVPLRTANSNGAKAYINDHIINCVGRITMDLTMYDISDIPNNKIQIGDWVELFGRNIDIDDLAQRAGTVGYEILTSMGHRY